MKWKGEELRRLRLATGLTQDNLGQKIGLLKNSQRMVWRWENGDAVPNAENLMKICKFFNLRYREMEKLWEEEDEE